MGNEESSNAFVLVELSIAGILQLSKTDSSQCGVIHRDGVLDASAVFGMALLATSDAPVKRRRCSLKQRFIVGVANDAVRCLHTSDRRMTGIATILQKCMRLRKRTGIDRVAQHGARLRHREECRYNNQQPGYNQDRLDVH